MLMRLAVILFACALGFAGIASAQVAPPSADEEARARFEAGRAAFAAGHNEDALADFRRSYELSGRVELLFNIGQALDRLRRDDEAIAAFDEYVSRTAEDAAGHREAAERAAFLRNRAAATASGAAAPLPPSPGPDPGAIAVIVAGAVCGVAGGVMLGLGEADRATVESATAPTTFDDIRGAYDRGPVLEAVGIAALALGVVGATVGVVWAVGGSGAARSSASAEVALGPGGIAVRGTF